MFAAGVPGEVAAPAAGATATAAGGTAMMCRCVQITACSACLWCHTQLATLAGHSSSALTKLNQANVCLPGLMSMKAAQEVCCTALLVLFLYRLVRLVCLEILGHDLALLNGCALSSKTYREFAAAMFMLLVLAACPDCTW